MLLNVLFLYFIDYYVEGNLKKIITLNVTSSMDKSNLIAKR